MSVSEEEVKILKNIGFQIGRRREALNMTQEDIAKKLNIDRGNYTKMENGNRERRFNYSQLVDLVEILNTSFDYIFGKTNEATPDIDIKNFCNRYGIKEETLEKIETLNENSIISFNTFINGSHITPYIFDEIYCYSANKNICKNLILFSTLFNYGELINKYYKEKDYKKLQIIFDYFDNFLNEANKYNTTHLKYEYELLKIYLKDKDFKTTFYQKKEEFIELFSRKFDTNVKVDLNGMDIEILEYTLKHFQFSSYGNEKSNGELTEINIINYLLYMSNITKKILKNMQKEIAYNKYTISSIFNEYINRIEGFQYKEDLEELAQEEDFIKKLNKEQNKLIKEGENNEHKRKSKK